MDIKLQIDEKFDDLFAVGKDVVERVLDLVAQSLWGEVRREAPVDQGRLAGSFLLEKRDALTYSIYTKVEYAMAVHEGTRPRVIEPVTRQALWWPGAAHPVRRVNHPGTKGNPYAERAVATTESRINEFAEIALSALSKEHDL